MRSINAKALSGKALFIFLLFVVFLLALRPAKIDEPLTELIPHRYYNFQAINEKEGIIVDFYGPCVGSKLKIPATIEGKKVVGIGARAFAYNFKWHEHITEVEIPATVREINEYAFEDNIYLEKVTFAGGSELDTIYEGAFAGNAALSSIDLPPSLRAIETGVFAGAENLTEIDIKNVQYIADEAFLGSAITNIITDDNEIYRFADGLLIENGDRLLYAAPDLVEVTVPYGVIYTANRVFYNHPRLEKINLNQVAYIGYEAFANARVLREVEGDAVKCANKQDFSGAPWSETWGEVVILGKTLLSYAGADETYVAPDHVVRVGHSAFASATLKRIVLPAPTDDIGSYAFAGCGNLKEVILHNTGHVFISSEVFGDNENAKLYVPKIAYETYARNVLFSEYLDRLQIKNVRTDFFNPEGVHLETVEIPFYSHLWHVDVAHQYPSWKVEALDKFYSKDDYFMEYDDAVTLIAAAEEN